MTWARVEHWEWYTSGHYRPIVKVAPTGFSDGGLSSRKDGITLTQERSVFWLEEQWFSFGHVQV